MKEGERCLDECDTRNSDNHHVWHVDMALKLGISTDVIDLHLHDLVWCYFVVQQVLRGAHLDRMDLLQVMRRLSKIWAAEGEDQHDDDDDDLSSVLGFLATVMKEKEGDIRSLADFIWHKLSNTSDLERGASDGLPAYL